MTEEKPLPIEIRLWKRKAEYLDHVIKERGLCICFRKMFVDEDDPEWWNLIVIGKDEAIELLNKELKARADRIYQLNCELEQARKNWWQKLFSK